MHIIIYIRCTAIHNAHLQVPWSLHTEVVSENMTWQIVTTINLYYFSIFQYHNNNTTNINNIYVHLTVIVSLRVPPLLAYDLSNFDVILLFNSVSSFSSLLSNLTTALLYIYTFGRYCKIGKLSESHDFINHSLKLGSYYSIFMRSRYIKNSSGEMWESQFNADTNYPLIYTKRILYNIPIRIKYFYFKMNMHT